MEIFKHWLQKVSTQKFRFGSFDSEVLTQNFESEFRVKILTQFFRVKIPSQSFGLKSKLLTGVNSFDSQMNRPLENKTENYKAFINRNKFINDFSLMN